jgi:hypothetical protein
MSRPSGVSLTPVIFSSYRAGAPGSTGVALQKKLSSCVVARPVWASVDPIIPALNGFTPSFASRALPSDRSGLSPLPIRP